MANAIRDKINNGFQLLVFNTHAKLNELTHGRSDTVYYVKADENYNPAKSVSYTWNGTAWAILSQVQEDLQFSTVSGIAGFPTTGDIDDLYCNKDNYIYEWSDDINDYRFMCEVSSVVIQLVTGISIKYSHESVPPIGINKDSIYKIGFDGRLYLGLGATKFYIPESKIALFKPVDGREWTDIYGTYTPPEVPIVNKDDIRFMQINKYDPNNDGRVDLSNDTLRFAGKLPVYYDNKFNDVNNKIGDITALTTDNKTSAVDALNEHEIQINNNISDLSNIKKYIQTSNKLKAVDMQVFNYTVANMQTAILRAQGSGVNLVILSISYSQNTTDNITVANSGNSNLGTIIDYCNSIGMNVAVKMHIAVNGGGTAIAPSDIPTWFSNWTNTCLSVANICNSKNVQYLGVSNELYTMTNGNNANWQTLINSIKTVYPNLKLFLSVAKSEYTTCIIYNLFDIIGLNYYPGVTVNGINETDTNMRSIFYNDLDNIGLINNIQNLKITYNKPIWITEIGCASFSDALKETAVFTTGSGYNEAVQSFYYKYIFDVVWNLSCIDAMSLWQIGDSQAQVLSQNSGFSFQYKSAENIVNQYWRG